MGKTGPSCCLLLALLGVAACGGNANGAPDAGHDGGAASASYFCAPSAGEPACPGIPPLFNKPAVVSCSFTTCLTGPDCTACTCLASDAGPAWDCGTVYLGDDASDEQ